MELIAIDKDTTIIVISDNNNNLPFIDIFFNIDFSIQLFTFILTFLWLKKQHDLIISNFYATFYT